MKMDATIVIPQFNRIELTLACVRSIRAKESIHWPIIVVDDGSEMVKEEIRELFSAYNVKLIFQEHQGVTAAWNCGLESAQTNFIVLLNNDVIFHGEVVESLLKPLHQEKTLLTGVQFRREKHLPRGILRRMPTEIFLEGWCLGFQKELWKRSGGFDESMNVYWSDTDFQLRVILDNGGRKGLLKECSGLPISHQGNQTTRGLKDRRRCWGKDRERFFRNWETKLS